MQSHCVKKNINHEFIEASIKNFLEKGGQIRILPPQKHQTRTVIMGNEWGAYEALGELSY
ncbi:MAG: hypothetical protein HQM14_05040 [SAR324 cluster bacterium]|nr:hypothetical protein [SAR324 cluster bacterium]